MKQCAVINLKKKDCSLPNIPTKTLEICKNMRIIYKFFFLINISKKRICIATLCYVPQKTSKRINLIVL